MRFYSKLFDFVNSKNKLPEIALKSGQSLFLKVASVVVNYLFLYIITSNLGLESWGVFAICLSVVQFIGLFGNFGVNIALVKTIASNYKSRTKQLYLSILKFIIPFNILITILAFFSSTYVDQMLLKDGVSILLELRITSLGILPMSLITINGGFFRGKKNLISFYFFTTFGKFLLSLLFTFIFLYFLGSHSYIIILSFVSSLYILCFFSIQNVFRILKKEKMSGNEELILDMKTFFKTSFSMFLGNFVNAGTLFAITFISGILLTKEQVGIFDSVFRLAKVLNIILFAINTISGPIFARGKHDLKILKQKVHESSKLIFISTIVTVAFLIPLCYYIIQFLEYEDSDFVFNLFLILLLGQLIMNLTGSIGVLMNMTGYNDVLKNFALFSFVFTTTGLYLVIPIYGIMGTSIIICLNNLIINGCSVMYMYGKTNISTIYNPFARVVKLNSNA
ncbi:oligosaccharide flippase family protein [Flavobacteriaceae bacterium]|nr:oligosaccharide flippase family protein [Flavobacteriaceae bacterium]